MNREDLVKKYNEYKKMNLHIDMTRGRPSKEQLDLSTPMFDVVSSNSDYTSEEGVDCRNYGCLTGLKECKDLFASILEVPADNIIIFGNSSLNIMYECLADAFLYGVCGSTPWSKLEKVKWLCPVPGYDRHFAICEHLGIEMINVPMNENGPDMDIVEELIKDPLVKGIWCVPKYSNPTGITYSSEVVNRFAKLKPASKDFRVFWDNAYAVHHLYKDKQDFLLELLSKAKKYHNEDIVYIFSSTSKISFPGGGIAALAASNNNLSDIEKKLKFKTIGFDKINQLRHARFFKNIDGIKKQMAKHAKILRPKFELIEDILEKEAKGLVTWTKPNGGYFISLFVNNKAKEIIERCKECGVILTEAGCAYPYHSDPNNSHIRLAPSCLSIDELKQALSIVVNAINIEMNC